MGTSVHGAKGAHDWVAAASDIIKIVIIIPGTHLDNRQTDRGLRTDSWSKDRPLADGQTHGLRTDLW